MKKILILSGLFLMPYLASSQSTESADVIMQRVYAQAKKENKNVFLKFSASWCHWCHKMEAALHDQAIEKKFLKNYVFQTLIVKESKDKVHLENSGGEEICNNFGGDKQGLPYWVVLSPDGKILANSKKKDSGLPLDADGDNVGCPAQEDEIAYFLQVLKSTSKLKEKDLSKVEARFKKIKADMEAAK